MAFYDLSKSQRDEVVEIIHNHLIEDFSTNSVQNTKHYFADDDTYIRKAAYIETGKIYYAIKTLQNIIISNLEILLHEENFKIRQTVINAAGEIGKKDFEVVGHFFDTGLFDPHHSPRNAVIGSIKKMGEKNPLPILEWSKKYLHHPDKEIRREICHGIELRGRTHPQEILPLLKELQFDKTARVRKTLVHELGQIAYKKGCLKIVLDDLKTWDNQQIIKDACAEILVIHERYKNFSVLTTAEAKSYIEKEMVDYL